MGIGEVVLRLPGVRGVFGVVQRWYRGRVENELRKWGLRYDDLLNEFDPEIAKVLAQLPPREIELRQKRLLRAMDLDLKKTYLAPEVAAKEDVWNPYIRSRLAVLKKQRLEKQISDYQVHQVKE